MYHEISNCNLPAVTAIGLGQRHCLFEESALKKRFRQTDLLCIPLVMRVGNIQTCTNAPHDFRHSKIDHKQGPHKHKSTSV